MSSAPPLRLDTAACDRCGRCVPACPARALRVGPGYIYVDWEKCSACCRCADACEEGAITVRNAAASPQPARKPANVVPIDRAAGGKSRGRPGSASKKAVAGVGVPGGTAAGEGAHAATIPWTLPEAFLVLAVAFTLLIGMQALRGTVASGPEWAGVLHAGYYGIVAGAVWFLARRRGTSVWTAFALDRAPEVANVLLSVAVAIGCWLFAVTFRAITGPGAQQSSDGLTSVFGTGLLGMVSTFALVAVVASLLEEALLRGVVLRALAVRIGRWPAIAATGLAFALLHASWASVIPLTVLGVGVGWLALRGRSLWPAVVAHALYNAVFLVAFYYASAR